LAPFERKQMGVSAAMACITWPHVIFLLLVAIPWAQSLTEDQCEKSPNCKLVGLGKKADYGSIQSCIDAASDDTTCFILPGRYHEEVKIATNMRNLKLTADPDKRPTMDGTVVLSPLNGWTLKDGKCTGTLDIKNDRHPFQLFLKKNKGQKDPWEMMTNARWPNAVWTDRHSVSGAPTVFYNDNWAKSDGTSKRDKSAKEGTMVDKKKAGVSPLASLPFSVKGAMAILNVGSFNTFVKEVKSHKAGENTFTYVDDFDNGKYDIKFKPSMNQYFLDSHEDLLDTPGEWYYNKATKVLKFMPWNGACPNGKDVRGRVIDYFFDITKADGLEIENLDFFASNLQGESTKRAKAGSEIRNVVLDSLIFKFPSSSKRMLQDDSVPKITRFFGRGIGALDVRNCEFIGGEGPALQYYAFNGIAKITNNLFKWNDWTGQMGLKANGGYGTVYSRTRYEEFVHNTLEYNGASAGFTPSVEPKMTDNLIKGQCHGGIMHDGAGIQIQSNSQPGSVSERNWILDSPKRAIRFDSSPGRSGTNATVRDNVVQRTWGIMVKGDDHKVYGNLGLKNFPGKENDASLLVMHKVYYDKTNDMNTKTIVEDNAAYLADGGPYGGPSGGKYNFAGKKKNNLYGDNYYKAGGSRSGIWVLDGTRLSGKSSSYLHESLVDPGNSDFRPKQGSDLDNKKIGPYQSKYDSGTGQYLIPGRKEVKASYPIPDDKSKVKGRDCLIFRPAYRCPDHEMFIAEEGSNFPTVPTATTSKDGNVVVLADAGFSLTSGKTYKWRVDCIQGSQRRHGDEWTFSME